MEVMGIVWAVVGGLSLVAAIAEIRNRLILRAERKEAERRAREEEERRAREEAERKARPTAKQIYFAMKAKENRHCGAPRLYR